jgi:hypothetical protein
MIPITSSHLARLLPCSSVEALDSGLEVESRRWSMHGCKYSKSARKIYSAVET